MQHVHTVNSTVSLLSDSQYNDLKPNHPRLYPPGITLTKREAECLYFLARAYTTKKIAQALDLSPRTIETYINNIKDKLGVIYKSEITEKAMSYHYGLQA